MYYKSDWLGIASASLCVVHCLFMPILIIIATNFTWWHEISYLFLLVSFFAAFEASKNAQKVALSIIWSSFALLTMCILFEEERYMFHNISYLASLGLIFGHIYNLKYCKKCNHD
jgi:hypothetical protein